MIEKKVLEYIRKYHMIEKGDRVLIGLSGGADSAALFHILRKYQKELGFELLAVHVNHGLRGAEAQRDQEFVETLCREYEIPCQAVEMPVRQMAAQRKIGLEEAGREARREVFQICRENGKCTKLALAHHKNDQAETMLHHLARGTGLAGLSGFSPADGFCIRPLLCLEREEIEHYLQEAGFAHVEDSSNREDTYTRNRIRHEILVGMKEQINGKAVEHMAKTAEILRQTDRYLKRQGKELLKKYQRQYRLGEVFLEEAFFCEEAVPAYYGLRELLSGCFQAGKDIGADQFDRLWDWIQMPVGKILQLPHGIRARREYGGVSFYREKEAKGKQEGFCIPLPIPGEAIGPGMRLRCKIMENNFAIAPDGISPNDNNNFSQLLQKTYTKWLNYDKIKGTVEIRTRRPGDYLVVDASGGRKKLKDYFIDCKVPRQDRDRMILAAQGQEILWVVGLRISEAYKVRPDTKQVLEMVYEGGYGYGE